MCTVLYWAQGWWSVTGLAIEIAGFSALSLDVAREYAVTLGSLFSYRCLDGRLDPSPAELRAVLTCPREPGVDALPNYAALKFRKHAEHLKHCLAGGRRRIEPLLVKEPALSPLLVFSAALPELCVLAATTFLFLCWNNDFDSPPSLGQCKSRLTGADGAISKARNFEPGRPPDIARRPFQVFPHNPTV